MKDIEKSKNSDLSKAFDENEFAAEVFSQLSKEFAKIGVLIEFSDEELLTFENFKNRLTDEIELVMRSSSSRIDQLLYLSDLSENTVKAVFKTEENPVEELSKMLLLRTAKKIHFRRQYKLGLL
jgi:dihydrodipicolinate reductase